MIIGAILRQAPPEHKKQITKSILCKILEIFCAAIPCGVIYLALKMILGNTAWGGEQVIWLTGITAAALGAQFYFGVKGARYAFIGGYGIFASLRLRLLEHLSRMPLGFFQHKQVGSLTAVVTENVKMVEDIFTKVLGEFISCLALPAFIGLLLVFIDRRMGLAALISAPLAFAVLRLSQNYFARLAQRRMSAHSEASGRLLEYIDGIKVIKSFGQEGKNFSSLKKNLRDQRNLGIKLEVFGGLTIMLFAIVMEMGFTAILVVGAYAMLGGEIAPHVYLMGMVISQKYFIPFTRAGFLLVDIKYLELAYAPIKAIFDQEELRETPHPVPFTPGDIVFDQVLFKYNESDPLPALSSICLTVKQAHTTALVGPSGSGKSTLAHLLARFYDVSGGSIKIGAADIREISFSELMANVSMVLQDVYIFNDTIANNIRLGNPQATDAELVEAARSAQCHDFIKALPNGYETMVGEGGARLSGGQKQRLSIARALLKNAPILLLDESTASIDPENARSFHNALARLSVNRTVLIIAHRLNTIRAADEIVVLNRGRVAQTGKHEVLLRQEGMYRDLCLASQSG